MLLGTWWWPRHGAGRAGGVCRVRSMVRLGAQPLRAACHGRGHRRPRGAGSPSVLREPRAREDHVRGAGRWADGALSATRTGPGGGRGGRGDGTVREGRRTVAGPPAPGPELGHFAQLPDEGARSTAPGAAGCDRGRFRATPRTPQWDAGGRLGEPAADRRLGHADRRSVGRLAAHAPGHRSATGSTCGKGPGARSTRSWRPTATVSPSPDRTRAPPRSGGLTAARTFRLHLAVHSLPDEGMALRAIDRHLDLARNAVPPEARPECPARLDEGAAGRPGAVHPVGPPIGGSRPQPWLPRLEGKQGTPQ
jgi:hypothetical protein